MIGQPVTDARLNEFIGNLSKMYAEHWIARGYTFEAPPTFRASKGAKNIKIITERGGGNGGSVYCFIEKDTGNILKAASWQAPAKGERGSIWNADCDVGHDKPCNIHGGNLYR